MTPDVIQATVFTRCKSAVKSVCTNVVSAKTDSPSSYPCTSVVLLGAPMTKGSYTSTMHGCTATIEVEVISQNSSSEVDKIFNLITESMDNMMFGIVYGPSRVSDSSLRKVARYRRVIGAGDSI